MSFDEKTFTEIARYLNDDMDQVEREAFDKRLESDAELASFVTTFSSLESVYNEEEWNIQSNTSVEEIKALAKEFRAEDVSDLSKKIRSIQQGERNRSIPQKNKKKTYFYYISSAVAVAAVCTLFYFSFFQSLTAVEAFEQYHDWSALPSFQTKSDTQNTLANAEDLFQQKQYKEALDLFKAHEKTSTTYHPNVQLYIGVSQLELENYAEAIQTFTTLQESDAIDHHKAYWYLALTYLKQNDTESAIKILDILLKDSSNYNYEKAKKLRADLK